MIIAGIYSFNRGKEVMQQKHRGELREIRQIICAIDCSECRSKVSKEKTMPGRVLYDPRRLNGAFRAGFSAKRWNKHRVACEYSTAHYVGGYRARELSRGAFREMDFIKNEVGAEVQFGKYAFMVYNVCAKMTIFRKLGLIEVGVEIVPVKSFADEMSTGVSYFEQIVWDLEQRGVADIDIPVLILGVAA